MCGGGPGAVAVGDAQVECERCLVGQRRGDGAVLDFRRDALPFAPLPRAGVGGEAKFGFCWRISGGEFRSGDRAFHLDVAKAGQGGFSKEHAVDEGVGFGEVPEVTVLEFNDDAEVAQFGADEVVALAVAVQRVGEVVGAIEKKDGAFDACHMAGRVPFCHPSGAGVRGHLVEPLGLPDAVLVEESAAIDGHGGLEAVVHAGDDAGEIAAPGDAGERGPGLVHFRHGKEERMRADGGGDRVVGPHVLRGKVGAEFRRVVLTGAGVRIGALFWPLSRGIHRDAHVAALCPMHRPIPKGFASPAVDEDDRGMRPLALGASDVCKDAGRLAHVGFAFVPDFLGEFVGRAPVGFWGLAEFFGVPGIFRTGDEEACEEEKENAHGAGL